MLRCVRLLLTGQGSQVLSAEYSFNFAVSPWSSSHLSLVLPALGGNTLGHHQAPTKPYTEYHTPPHSALGTYTPTASLPLQGFARLQGFETRDWARLVGCQILRLAGILTCISDKSSCKAA
jgi:hypothetical protein